MDNKYSSIYEEFIDQCRNRQDIKTDFYEMHHILPKSLGGSNDSSNLVKLTPREHFFAHLLLSKMYDGTAKIKMVHALQIMAGVNRKKKIINSRQYELARNIIYRVLQSSGKEYQQEKEIQDKILTEYTDLDKVVERGLCKTCGVRPKAINYVKNKKIYYRSKCDVCLTGKNDFKLPSWKFDGYKKLSVCEHCGFHATYTEQLTVISELKKYKTICLNCQVVVSLKLKKPALAPIADF